MIKTGLTPKLAETRKIKTGFKGPMVKSKKGKEFRPPKKVDYFFITFTERDKDGNLIVDKELMKKIGEKPEELKIRLPFDTVDKNFFTQFQCYVGNKKICSGDGEAATRKGLLSINKDGYPEATGDLLESREIPCNPDKCPIYQAEKCKVSGILSTFLPQCSDIGGVAKYRTHSYNAVASILGALNYFYENTGGILQGLPLKLIMLKKTTAEHGTIAYPTIVIDGEEIMRMKNPQLTGGSDIKGLRLLSIDEKHSRDELNIDMTKIEREAEQQGFFKDSDPEDEIQAEYYVVEEEAEPDPEKKEPEKKGSSPEDLGEKLEKKQKKTVPAKKAEPKKEVEPEPDEEKENSLPMF